jgi:hypothetical protein
LKDDIIYLSQEQSAALSKEGSMLFGKWRNNTNV